MTNTVTYIEAAVTLPTFRTYTYSVPDGMADLIGVGRRVLLPFGSRRITGYVITAPAPAPPPEVSVKPICDVLDDRPLFHASHLSFFNWISSYYLFPPGEVIKSALPGGITTRDNMWAALTDLGREAALDPATADRDRAVLSRLSDGPRTAAALMRDTAPPLSRSALSTLARKGLIELNRELTGGTTGQKFETLVRWIEDAPPPGPLTPAREKVLALIREHGEMPLSAVGNALPGAHSKVRFLESRGQVLCVKKKLYRDPFGDPVPPDTAPTLTDEQAEVVATVGDQLGRGFTCFMLAGVTGSGKTEVYLQLVEQALARNLSALVLVPEIALIAQTERRFRRRFGEQIAVLHSSLSQGEKFDQWMRIADKEVTIVIGARSAVFAPLENLGLVIVDEEHDGSYKQENGLKYNARDLAVLRANLSGAVCLLGSATPSIQSYYNTTLGKFRELRLTRRVSDRPMPAIRVIDLKTYKDYPGMRSILTPPLEEAMARTLENGEQVLLFLNRRGYANYPVCATCGEPMKCVSCDVSLTLHQSKNAYRCHMCNYMIPATSKCRLCNSSHIKHLGFGTERIEAAVRALFPQARVARMDQDTTTRKGSVVRMLKDIKDRKTDILIGTQMIAKGHDFPGITLVGIICADQSLNFPDFRACERTFQLLAQVAGRAGRGDQPGQVIMQTYNPNHFSILAAEKQDFESFYQQEIAFRNSLGYPPFSRMAQIRISGKDRNAVKDRALALGDLIGAAVRERRPLFDTLGVLGPIEAAIPKLADQYRWQVLLKCAESAPLHRMARLIAHTAAVKDGIRITIDIDPYYLM
ncbi:replication restart helicase PriA [Desulfatiferula olefinivorans]